MALLILACWTLVIEPTFGIFERMEENDTRAHNASAGGEISQEMDQPVPPGELVPFQWDNHHERIALVPPLVDSPELAPHEPVGFSAAPALHATDPLLPYPPPARPLRL